MYKKNQSLKRLDLILLRKREELNHDGTITQAGILKYRKSKYYSDSAVILSFPIIFVKVGLLDVNE